MSSGRVSGSRGTEVRLSFSEDDCTELIKGLYDEISPIRYGRTRNEARECGECICSAAYGAIGASVADGNHRTRKIEAGYDVAFASRCRQRRRFVEFRQCANRVELYVNRENLLGAEADMLRNTENRVFDGAAEENDVDSSQSPLLDRFECARCDRRDVLASKCVDI